MIVGVPSHIHLMETATGWMNLAWELIIAESHSLDEIEEIWIDQSGVWTREEIEGELTSYLHSRRLHLNNAISLLQQSLEIFLKAKIAEVSPFLLIAGEVSSWPSPDSTGNIDFSNFRTIDAVHLCRAAKISANFKITDEFVTFYDRIRKTRNKVVHLNASSVKAEVHEIMLDILTAHKHLFSQDQWVSFRTRFMDSGSDKMTILSGHEFVHDVLMNELDTVFNALEPRHLKMFFGYDPKKKDLQCPQCVELRSKYSESSSYAQKQDNGTIRCAACLLVVSAVDYKARILEQLDPNDRGEIVDEIDRDLN
jgi:hypothetical protein